MSGPALIECPTRVVPNDWIDYNGHMNVAYYSMAFDQALDFVFDELGIGAEYVRSQQASCFVLESHISYLRELKRGDPFRITFQLLDCDNKRLHYFEQMFHKDHGFLAATSEQISIHIDMNTRRSAAFPQTIQAHVDELMQSHRALLKPEQAGRTIGITRRG